MTNSSDRPYTFDRVIRLVISVALLVLGIYMIYILRRVLLPFLIAWLIAYLLDPVVRFLQRKLHLRKRFVAVLLTFVLLAATLTLIFVSVTPLVKKEIIQINSLISTYEIQSFTVDGIPLSVHDFIENHIDFQSLRETLTKQSATESLKFIMPAIQDVLSSSISFILGFTVIFIIILYMIFILLDYDKINQLWMNLIPPKYRSFVSKLTVDVESSMNNYFRHQALICVIVGALFSICFQIVGLPLAIIIGILIGILHMIPYMHIMSIVPVILMCWLKASQTGQSFWGLIGFVALIYIGIQCIIDLFLVPKIMGKAMGLNPAIILLSLSIWGSLMGVAGMIIAIPMTTLILSYYQNFIESNTDEISENLIEDQANETQKE